MTQLKWTGRARRDLRDIHDYIARDSRKYALTTVERIKSSVEGCRRFPLASPMVEEWDRPDIRETYSGAYRVIYRVGSGKITVLAVIHSARQLPPMSSIG
jgi:toxin ParE1/3/4